MNFIEFKSYIDKLIKMDSFLFSERDAVVKESEIAGVEKELGVLLPKAYKQFVKAYGGGDFAYINIFSCDKDGEWYITSKNKEASSYLPPDFVAISDDQVGGFYGYIIKNNKCEDRIYYWDHENNFFDKRAYNDIIDFIIKVGLNFNNI
jgi:hypothetical protein